MPLRSFRARRARAASALSIALLSLAALSGCATGGHLREAERLALYQAHAGEPVPSINYLGHYSGWTPLGDGNMALWTRPSQAFLLSLDSPCIELDYADTIGFRNLTGGRLSARFDQVYVATHNLIPVQCRIREIRPLDVKAIRAAEKDERARRQVEESSAT